MSNNHQYLVLTDEKDIIEYEKGLLIAQADNLESLKNRYIKEADRLRPRLEQSDYITYGLKVDGNLVGGSSLNFNVNNLFIGKLGFDVSDRHTNPDYCEGFGLYMSDTVHIDTFAIFTGLYNEAMKPYLIDKGIKTIYSTCQTKLKNLYWMADWEIIQELDQRCLIALDVK